MLYGVKSSEPVMEYELGGAIFGLAFGFFFGLIILAVIAEILEGRSRRDTQIWMEKNMITKIGQGSAPKTAPDLDMRQADME